ncbi:MAG: UDP-N-acetylmuramate--L-alanine ligase [Planctomycetota bacterium]
MTDAPTAAISLTDQRLHFVGIGGCGMSGLARMAAKRGAAVTGSDRADSATVRGLRDAGIGVVLEQTAASLPAAVDTLVVSAAIPHDHAEVAEAESRGVEVVKYAAMLGRLMGQPGVEGVAIAGTHGKSTTTSVLCHMLLSCGLDPSFIVGANCEQIGGGARVSGGTRVGGEVLVAEACEFDRSFHALEPVHGVILNIEADHLDMYGSLDEIAEAFAVFARRLPSHGSLLIQHESPHRMAVSAGVSCGVQTIGFDPQADWQVAVSGSGERTVELRHHGGRVASWRASMPGEHMAYNAAVAAVTAHRMGAPWDGIAEAIAGFEGLDRRMQRLGRRELIGGGTVTVVDDYGHHPTEVDATLRALRAWYRPGRLVCVFQPHQHSRTRFLMEQFAVSFSAADVVIVPEIYFVRDTEQEREAVRANDLVRALRDRGVTAMHVDPMEAIVDQLVGGVRAGDLVVTMGAGDVWKVAGGLLERLPATDPADGYTPAG